MSGLFRRIRGVFGSNRSLPQTTSNRNPASNRRQQADYSDDMEDDIEGLEDDELPQQSRIGGQPRETPRLFGPAPSVASYNQPNYELRSTLNNLQSDPPRNNTDRPNINTGPISNPLTRVDLPTQSQIQEPPSSRPLINPMSQLFPNNVPSGINPNQTSPALTNPIPQSSLNNNPFGINPNQPSVPLTTPIPQLSLNNNPFGINPNQITTPLTNPIPQSSLNNVPFGINPTRPSVPLTTPFPQSTVDNGFTSAINQIRQPLRINRNPTHNGIPGRFIPRPQIPLSWGSRRSYPRQQNQPPFSTNLSSLPPQNNISNIQMDYPIENVLIDGNIPPSIAIKINEAVEYDRFGNAYHNQHYAYKPTTQNIILGNNQQIQRQSINNSRPNGMRYMREIYNENSYPQNRVLPTKNLNNLQLIIDTTPQINYQITNSPCDLSCYPPPIYLTACASPNDPMRCY